jgi:hypothetical protein
MQVRPLSRIAVLGGGIDARMLAAIALSEGAKVTLFSAYGTELDALRSSGVALRGAGPVGSYQTDAENAPSIRTTAELDIAVCNAEAIYLTGPIHKQRTYAMVLADHLADGQILVLPNARTFGALETRWLLGIGGCTADITIIEAELPFWAEAEGATLHLSTATPGAIASLPGGRDTLAIPHLETRDTAPSIRHTGFVDGSGLVEVPTLILGGPAVPDGSHVIPMGGVPLEQNNSFRHLIGAQHLAVINALAEERRAAARLFGIRDLPTTESWLDRHAGAPSGTGARPVPTQKGAEKIIRDAVIGSLVPLTSAARLANITTPTTDAMIALASSMLGADLATAGRKLPAMGVDGADTDTARRALEAVTGAG